MSKIYNYIYVTTNLINGKQYIGSHSTNIKDDSYLGSGKHLIRAVKKHGKINFSREILEEFDNMDKAMRFEEYYINKHKTLSPLGYNLSPTGGTPGPRMLSEEAKYRCGSSNRGKKTWMFGKKHTIEANEKNRKHHLGKKDTPETIIKRKLAMSGQKNPMASKSLMDVWISKYGKKEANIRYRIWREKISSGNTNKAKNKNKGKTYEEIFGLEKALEIKEKMGISHRGKKYANSKSSWENVNLIKRKCEYCDIETTPGNYKRWHGENCKNKKP